MREEPSGRAIAVAALEFDREIVYTHAAPQEIGNCVTVNEKRLLGDGVVSAERADVTHQLAQRESKPRNFEIELAAFKRLTRQLLNPTTDTLQELTDLVLQVCGAGSAGISIAEQEGSQQFFRWHAISGVLRPFLHGTVQRDLSPCKIVLEKNDSLLIEKPNRHWPYLENLGVPVHELLLTPFYRDGKAIGTIWAVSHTDDKKFDREDDRLLKSLAEMADLAVQAHSRFQNLDRQKNVLTTERDQAKSDQKTAEDERDSSLDQQHWLRQTLDHIPKPVFFLNLDSQRMWFSNRAAQEMLGLRYENEWDSAIQSGRIKIANAKGRPVVPDDFPSRRALRGETIRGEEYIIESTNGRFHVEVFVEQIPAKHGQPRSATMLIQDITALKKTEKRLIETQAELNRSIEIERELAEQHTRQIASERDNLIRLFETQPSPSVLWKGPDLVYERVSPSYQALFPRKVLIGKPFLEAVPEKEYAPYFSIIKSVYDTGVPVVMPEQLVPFDIDGKGMKNRYYTLSFFQVKDADGSAYGVYQQATDNTEQVQAREVLRAALEDLKVERQKLETIFQESPAAMALWQGKDLIFEKVNPKFQALFGDRPLVSKPLIEALPELTDQQFPKLLEQVMETGVPFVGKEVLAKLKRSEDGPMEDRYFDFTYLRVNDANGKPYGVYDHAIEVTDRVVARIEIEKAKLDAEVANQSKSAFLANMSHEIRTPLGAIQGFSDLARQPEATKEQITSYLGVIDRNAVQVLRIIDDILDLTKVEAGRVELEIIPFSLNEFIADLSSLLGFKARENGIAFNIRAETDLPDQICSDPTRLRQILTNAVGNAIKFTSKGRVTLHICFHDGLLEFGIEDTGRGISPEQAKNLFQAFAQADVSTTRKFGGTGLGLILAKRLCQLMGGDYILKRSELGVGSKFEASVKVDLPQNSKLIPKGDVKFENVVESIRPLKDSRLRGVRVLLVEDSPDNQMLLKLILERQGVQLDMASDGAEGVRKALGHEYDVVLMDIQMPLMDGHEAVRKLRASGYRKPIVALTAHAMKEESDRARKSGFTDFLSKPIQREDLIETVAQLLGRGH